MAYKAHLTIVTLSLGVTLNSTALAQCDSGGDFSVPGLVGNDLNRHDFPNQCLAASGTNVTITIRAMADLGCNPFDATHYPGVGDCPDSCAVEPPDDPLDVCCDTDPNDKYVTVTANFHLLLPSITGSTNMPANGHFFEEWSIDDTSSSTEALESGRSPCDPDTPLPNTRVVTISAATWNSWLGAAGNAISIRVYTSSAVHTESPEENALAVYCYDRGFNDCPFQDCSGLCGPLTFSRVTITYSGVVCDQDAQCNDSNPCTDDACGSNECQHTNNTDACQDGLFCTSGDTCLNGVCESGAPYACLAGEFCDEQTSSCQPDCNDNGVPDGSDIAFGTSLDCNTNDVPDECDAAQGTGTDCNTNGILDICALADEVVSYDAALGYLPTESDPAWMSGGTVPGTLPEDLLVINDISTQALAFYYRPNVFADSSQLAVFETTGQAISATNSLGVDFVWQAGLDDGSKYVDLAITTTGVGILYTGSAYVPGCVADFVTTDGLHTYKLLKHGTSHVDVFADGDLLFSCLYDDLADAAPNRAVLLASSTSGQSSFKIASFRYAIGGLSLTGTDCNTNGIPDECDLMDFDASGAVDLYDFAGFQICLGSTGGACLESFDRAASCGAIDLGDCVVFASQLTGPPPGGEMETMMGGGGEGMSFAVEPSEAEAEAGPPAETWTEPEASLSFEVRAVGGEAALNVLAPNSTYELHYQAGYGEINDYLLVAVAASTDQGLSGASAPSGGDWSPPVNFGFEDIPADEDWAQDWDGEGNAVTNLVYDYWLDTERSAGPEAHLCNFTTGAAGDLKLYLFMSWFDIEAQEGVSMQAEVEFVVE